MISLQRGGSAGQAERPATFGFIILGGAVNGASVRDIRLANELSDRGFPVHVWWALDRPHESVLRPVIEQHWLFHGLRYMGGGPRWAREAIGRTVTSLASDKRRSHFIQMRPGVIARMWEGQLRFICDGVEHDKTLVQRFAAELARAEVTHLLPALEVFCPWAVAARKALNLKLRFAVTFQGYEVYCRYARAIGLEQEFYDRIAATVRESDWPAIAVSDDYAARIVEDVGIPRKMLTAIPPGVPVETPMDREHAWDLLGPHLRKRFSEAPLVTFVGRQDVEKGIDLLLYAASILRRRGVSLSLAVCGATAFGKQYSRVCRQIAEELRLNVRWFEYVPDQMRSALFAVSHCVVYPSIHREPFGMAPVEAMSQGAPVLVPDWGGVASVVRADKAEGGLLFRAWDSGSLADQMERLIQDAALHRRLSAGAPKVAEHFSTPRMADRVLAHLGVADPVQAGHAATLRFAKPAAETTAWRRAA